MKIADLKEFGLPDQVITCWQEALGETLLPVQSRAVRKGLLGRVRQTAERHMVIAAPTSSGKSFCAEMAALETLTQRRKVVWLLPLKSLAEQTVRLLERRYAPLGIKSLIVTGDHPENDRAFYDGDFQVAVVIYEKFDLLLTGELDCLANIGLIVVDELQMVAEPGRGALLERLLTKLLASRYKPRLVGLSAALSDCAAEQLAAWLGAVLIEENVRPVDLLRGIAAGGEYRYRSLNSGTDGAEAIAATDPGADMLDAFIEQLCGGARSVLVFLKSRQDTVNLAFRLAAAVSWPSAKRAVAALASEESSFLSRSLTQALGRGVAFHNADLTAKQRTVVEQGFVDREVRVLFATTTLAMGVNLPADTVYLETVKYTGGHYDGRPSLVPLSRAEFDNMAGRAGRLGQTDEPAGRAIILADSEFDRDILWETYIAPAASDCLCSRLDDLPTVDWVLDMVASGLAGGRDDLDALYLRSLRGYQAPDTKPDWENALALLVEHRMISHDETTGVYGILPLGRALAGSGLSVHTARHYLARLGEGYPESMFGWLALALSGGDISLPSGILSRYEQARQEPLAMLYRRFDHAVVEARYIVPENHRQEPLDYRRAACLKALLLLHDWSRLVPAQRLEERFQLHLGQIMSLGETMAHRLGALALLVEAGDRGTPVVRHIRDYMFSVHYGLPESFRRLHKKMGEVLNRSDFALLRQESLETPADLCALSVAEIKKIFAGRSNLLAISEKIEELKEEVDMTRIHTDMLAIPGTELESVEIDGAADRERYVVRINGHPVRLTGKSFKYFAKLAWSRRHAEAGWMYKEDIEVGFNQARYLYRMKHEITSGLSLDWPVVENNRLGYYRLDIAPEKIQFNAENLRNHPDWEVRQLFNEISPLLVDSPERAN